MARPLAAFTTDTFPLIVSVVCVGVCPCLWLLSPLAFACGPSVALAQTVIAAIAVLGQEATVAAEERILPRSFPMPEKW